MKSIEYLLKHIMYDPLTGIFIRAKTGKQLSCKDSHGYIQFKIQGKSYLAHRLAFYIANGRWPTAQIDHINRDKVDNRASNLREVTGSQNCRNRPSHNSTGYKGVVSFGKKFGSCIYVDGESGKKKRIHLGMFDSPEHAHAAYVAATLEQYPDVHCTDVYRT